MDQASSAKPSDSGWKSLFRIGGVAAFIVAVLTVAEIVGFIFFPQPSTIHDWLLLFRSNRIVALMDFWGLEVPMYLSFIPVFLALYVMLGKANEGLTAVATALALIGTGVFLATNNPFSMLSLSDQYAAAMTDAQRSAILGAGQAILAGTNQRAVGGFNIALFLVSIAGLIVSFVMLRSSAFGRTTAYVGIVAFGLSLADYLRQAFTASAAIALLVILPGAVFLVVWFTRVGLRLYRFGIVEGKPPLTQP